ncbi:pyruvate kinase [Terrilactibacillus laevilacticus]|uniref:pyruvate kinase n=1 Tax=Terrilactibacillus laevilacticus TaxID=1380157 RepID=UPI00114713B0|nr:pyruvate kinase [Terrilactibacillus laevilacticus]
MTIDRICTIGPASQNKETLKKLIENGMTIVRLNLSHGTHESHREVIQLVKSLDGSIRILGDVQGPKIRLGEIPSGEVELKAGASFILHNQPIKGNEKEAGVDYKGITEDMTVGNRILINDGEVELVAVKVDDGHILTTVKKGGIISSHKGVNLPGTKIQLPAITEKDKKDIDFLLNEKVDFIACSFVRNATHIKEIRDFIGERTRVAPKLIVKVETMEAIKNFQEIVESTDGIMVARGDLGVECPYEWIPLLQKAIISECNRLNKYVITATQMLQSMVDHSIPTRAEVTDVFQAVLDGTNAVMLSAESASGDHPIESIETLRLVSQFAERMKVELPYDMADMLSLLKQTI